jgi:hypothetical protein
MFFHGFLFLGCQNEVQNQKTKNNDNFNSNNSLRILEPSNGATVDSIVEVFFEAGSAVDHIDIRYKGGEKFAEVHLNELESTGSENSFLLEIESGNQVIRLEAYGSNDNYLSERELTLNVDPLEHWVTITSPSDYSIVENPVQFVVNMSEYIEEVEVFVDGESIGFTDGQSPLMHEFFGLGYPRYITAKGYSYALENESDTSTLLAEHDVEITILDGTTPLDSTFNQKVLEILNTYPTDGSYAYYWPQDGGWLGTTQDIFYLDTLVAEGDEENRSYCVGLTWEVFMLAWEEMALENNLNDINSMNVEDLDDFRIDWYVRELMGSGVVEAVENYGIGERITYWEDIQPGDFLQFWRNNGSGHNNIFIEWVRNSSEDIVGVKYWSTQGSTNGVGYNVEFFWPDDNSIDPAYFYAARVYEPQYWISFQ